MNKTKGDNMYLNAQTYEISTNGVLYISSSQYDTWASGTGGGTVVKGIGINANAGSTSNNPMSGHAVGPDVRPYNISMLPLICY